MIENSDEAVVEQQNLEHQYTRWEAAKLYPRAAMYMLFVVFAMITVSYENQASGVMLSIPTFRKDFGHAFGDQYVLDSKWQSAISGGPLAGVVIGCAVAPSISDLIGRKNSLLISMATTIPSVAIEFVATSIGVFFAGKVLNSFFLGIVLTVGTMYMAEITPLALRALGTVAISLSMCIGPLVVSIITYGVSDRPDRWAYRSILCSQWFFGVVSLILIFFLPESPYHHLLKDNDEKALQSLRKIYGDEEVAAKQLEIMKSGVELTRSLAAEGSFLELFDKKNLMRTIIGASPFIMQSWSGLMYVAVYLTYYVQLLGFGTLKSFQVGVAAQTLSTAGAIVALIIIDRLGRRVITLFGMASLALLNLLTACLGMKTERPYLTAAVAFLTMFNFFYNCGIGPVAYAISTEVPTASLKGKTISLGLVGSNSLSTMWLFVLPYMFNPDEANMGSKINFIYGAACLLSLSFFYFYLPETNGRSYEEIDEMFKRNIPARQWKGYKFENDPNNVSEKP